MFTTLVGIALPVLALAVVLLAIRNIRLRRRIAARMLGNGFRGGYVGPSASIPLVFSRKGKPVKLRRTCRTNHHKRKKERK